MLLSEFVEVTWTGKIKSHYVSRGYKFSKMGDKFVVSVNDLTNGSHIKVNVKCCGCDKLVVVVWSNYVRSRKDNKYMCADCAPTLRRRSIENIRNLFYEKDYIPKFAEFKNGKCKLDYVCSKHPEVGVQSTTVNTLQESVHSCRSCVSSAVASRRTPESVVRQAFEARGYILHLNTGEYKNIQQKLKYTCRLHAHHKNVISFSNFMQGQGCPLCANEYRSRVLLGVRKQYKDGLTKINAYLRTSIRAWVIESFKKYGGKCCISGATADTVHHTYPFYKIVKEAHANIGLKIKDTITEYLESEELTNLENECIRLHYVYGLGVPLTKQIGRAHV